MREALRCGVARNNIFAVSGENGEPNMATNPERSNKAATVLSDLV